MLVSRGHRVDEDALRHSVGRGAAYVGMIGSRRRTGTVLRHLLEEGFDSDALEAVSTPIGLDIGAETPEEIAVSILAEMIMIQRGGSGERMQTGRRPLLSGGPPADGDLSDVIYGGDGNDSVDGGHGNDRIFGGAGDDTLAGGFGADTIEGQDGDDVITGSAFSDQVFGGNGDDFVNGGFGHDRVNGGAGADKFFHVGIEGHGSDWIQDYDSAEGDVLVFGNAAASASDFQVNFAHTADSAGERAGADDVMEAFVIYKPTGQIMWALVDGQGQASIDLSIGGGTPFDLLA